jgi:hypothetical protein
LTSRHPSAGTLQRLAGIGRGLRGLDQGDHLVEIGQGDGQAFQDMGPLARLAQLKQAAAGDHFAPVRQKGRKHRGC